MATSFFDLNAFAKVDASLTPKCHLAPWMSFGQLKLLLFSCRIAPFGIRGL